jgi:ADP-ribose pyrophosphatase
MNITWKRLEPTKVQKLGWRTIVTKRFALPDGSVHEFDTKEKEDTHAAAVVALTKDNKVIVARQFRPGPERILTELPGGGVEKNEDWIKAAARELQEETGYVAGKIIHTGDIFKDAYTNTTWHYFLAEDCELHADGANPDEREFIDIELITIPELFSAARGNQMTDTEGVFLAYEQLIKKLT